MHVIATAGHVDHGKSTLVRRLTGTDPDRWDEEKARGLTIDLGFAHLALPSSREVAFVDVPGHTRFIKNMLAGVGAVDATLFIVAASEGWKPQSEEHLRILDLLGLRHGIVVLTKIGLCDDDLIELARLDVAEHVEGTFLEDAPVIAVDALTNVGVDDLVAALEQLTATTPTSADMAKPRLWIDRAFAAKGSGTVVTGTLAGGTVAVEDELVLLPHQQVVRVRALQTHYRQEREVRPGHRLALNLSGVSYGDVERGNVLVRDGQWHLTQRFDASLTVLESLDHDVSRRGAYVTYVGSGELPVQLRVLGSEALRPGDTGFVRIHLPWPIPLVPGDHFVVRESGRKETVGGGEVLDVEPMLTASKARPDRSIDRVVAERGWVDAQRLTLLTGTAVPPSLGRWVVAPAALAALTAEVESLVDDAGPLGADLAAFDERQRAVLDTLDGVTIEAGRAKRGSGPDPLADHPFVAALDASPFAPPPPDGHDRAEIRELVRRGIVVSEDGTFFSAAAVERAGLLVAKLLQNHPDGITLAQIRDAMGNTRKHVLPLAAILDGLGMTRRREDLRIAGPRLPQPDAQHDAQPDV